MRLLCAVAAALLATGASPAARAWETRPCPTDAAYQPNYGSNGVWPLMFLSNMSSGSGWREDVEGAMGSWNSIYGAYDELSVAGSGYGYCEEPDNAGIGVIGWDGGACYAWGPDVLAITVVWTSQCDVLRTSVYFNSDYPSWDSDEMRSTALHELGHYQNYAHNWDEVSIMGYSDTEPEMPMTFLTAPDHDFMRSVWSSGNSALPDLYLTRFVLRSPIIPGQASMTVSPPPSCSGDCQDLRPGDEVAVTLTYGNAGSTAVSGAFLFKMMLGDNEIGTWTSTGLGAHAQNTYEFVGTIPWGIPPGSYWLEVAVDPDGAVSQSTGPTPGETVRFYGFGVRLPLAWACDAAAYDASDGCDCECGVYDPDCDRSTTVYGCSDGLVCTDDRCNSAGHCVHPENAVSCDDGQFCTVDDRCGQGTCQGSPRDCSAETSACSKGSCDEGQRRCVPLPSNEGDTCDDGRFCTVGDRCGQGTCQGSPRDCTSLDTSCTVGTCDEADQRCEAVPAHEKGPCDDGRRCTVDDQCVAGACQGTPRDCSALDGPCSLGRCDEATGSCVRVVLDDGTRCDDGVFCVVGKTCVAGVCSGTTPRDCSALDGACTLGSCDESARKCVAQPVRQGESCDDGKRCTLDDRCQAGTCAGTPKDCRGLDGVCVEGRCDEGTGQCGTRPRPDGLACDDGQYCTVDDACGGGTCAGAPRNCSAPAGSCLQGSCDEGADRCVTAPKPDGAACDDGVFCTVNETCLAGVCSGTSPRDCSALSGACTLGSCDESAKTCVAQPVRQGETCDDGKRCTLDDRCQAGACAGTPKDCRGLDGVCVEGYCAEGSGQCATRPRPDGLACDDGQFCTVGDACGGGTCAGAPRDCSAPADSCLQGRCDESADRCVTAPKPDGTACEDGRYCTAGDSCREGRCEPGATRDCSSLSDACHQGRCDEEWWGCTSDPLPEGTPCDDGRTCTLEDRCEEGFCRGTERPCEAGPCMESFCEEGLQRCSTYPKPDGRLCDDGNACTRLDECQDGQCVGQARNCSHLDDPCHLGKCDAQTGACVQEERGGPGCDEAGAASSSGCGCATTAPRSPGLWPWAAMAAYGLLRRRARLGAASRRVG